MQFVIQPYVYFMKESYTQHNFNLTTSLFEYICSSYTYHTYHLMHSYKLSISCRRENGESIEGGGHVVIHQQEVTTNIYGIIQGCYHQLSLGMPRSI